jgi:hypothetical protein
MTWVGLTRNPNKPVIEAETTKEQHDSIRRELLSLGGSMGPGYVYFCDVEIHRSNDNSTTPETRKI